MKKQLLTAAAILGILLSAFASASAYQATQPEPSCHFNDYFVITGKDNVQLFGTILFNGSIQAVKVNSNIFNITENSPTCGTGNATLKVVNDTNGSCTLTIQYQNGSSPSNVSHSCEGNISFTGMTHPSNTDGYGLIFSTNPNK